MRSLHLSTWLAAAAALSPVFAQTFTSCNPLNAQCPPDPALGKTTTINFAGGSSDQFTAVGSPSYDSSGAHFSVAKSGDAPTITSKWYLMFGRVDVVLQTAPGAGIVSTVVLESDCLDEVDFEWLGGDANQVQSNYFGKGQTGSYNRGGFHNNPGHNDGMHTYSVDWTADSIKWEIDGQVVRTLAASEAGSQYPQTPMQLKIGIWSGGDPSNAPGTVQWAGGPTNYGGGPYTMTVKSVKATDYSTGTQYTYGDSSGTWQSIKSNGGQIKSSGSGGSVPVAGGSSGGSGSGNTAPSAASGGQGGTHHTSSQWTEPSEYPWVPSSGAGGAAGAHPTTYPGLPSGWTVSSSGKVVPPSSAATAPPKSSPSSPSAASSSASSSAAAGSGSGTGSTPPIATGDAPDARTVSMALALGAVVLLGLLL